MDTLTMTRNGEFHLRVSGPSHCGILDELTIRYVVVITCEDKLDRRGFLFDQLTVHKFFSAIRHTELSCEELARDCTHRLIARIHEENPDCVILSFKTTLSATPFAAAMTYDCRPPKRLESALHRSRHDTALFDWLMQEAKRALRV